MERPMAELNARVPCSVETRDDLRALKTDNQRYEDVLRELVAEYRDND
jgi:hypothetical protein